MATRGCMLALTYFQPPSLVYCSAIYPQGMASKYGLGGRLRCEECGGGGGGYLARPALCLYQAILFVYWCFRKANNRNINKQKDGLIETQTGFSILPSLGVLEGEGDIWKGNVVGGANGGGNVVADKWINVQACGMVFRETVQANKQHIATYQS